MFGGFVAGELKDNRRKSENVLNRCLVTLDADNIEPNGTQKVLNLVSGLGCGYAIYSTRKHCIAKPRLRIIIPTDRLMTSEEYEPIARKIASFIGMEIMDTSTFEASRLMYWPSCSKDSEFVFKYEDKAFASVDGLLALYANWKNPQEWPKVQNEPELIKREIAKQKDPLEKENVVGAFCKTYNIPSVIDTYLSDVYEHGNSNDKYTYANGSVANGATVYGDGRWLYSFHATDPASHMLCNSFDLVRIHKFSELDDEAKDGTPGSQLPSFKAMQEFALQDEKVNNLFKECKFDKAIQEFSVEAPNTEVKQEVDKSWLKKLKISAEGNIVRCAYNAILILENDENLKNKLLFDRFTGRFLVVGKLPWDYKKETSRRMWSDEDDACIRNYLDTVYNFKSPGLIKDALCELKMKKSTHVVQEYFKTLKWDGKERLDTLLIDYLGAIDTEYTRAVIRKELVAAVARVLTEKPIKFDNMIILTGAQGIGKSTFLTKLGRDWFTDNLIDFNSKDTLLIMQKCLIIEVPELQGFNKTDSNRLKQFMSLQTDTFRAPYDREAKEYPRHCIFFGTTNDSEFLKDRTGNRRYWPIECMVQSQKKNIFKDLDLEVDQIWAEAIVKYKNGEALYLEGEAERQAKAQQEAHRETSAWEGPIREFVTSKVTKNWLQVKILTRKTFSVTDVEELIERDRICAAEIWCECLGNEIKSMKISDSKMINDILEHLEFEDRTLKKNRVYFGNEYGYQRGFKIDYI